MSTNSSDFFQADLIEDLSFDKSNNEIVTSRESSFVSTPNDDQFSEAPAEETRGGAIAKCERCGKSAFSNKYEVVNCGEGLEETIMVGVCRKCLRNDHTRDRSSDDASVTGSSDNSSITRSFNDANIKEEVSITVPDHPNSPLYFSIPSDIIGLGSKTIIYGTYIYGRALMDTVHSINMKASTNFGFGIQSKKLFPMLSDLFIDGIITFPIELQISGSHPSSPISSMILVAVVINHQSNLTALSYDRVEKSVSKSSMSLIAIFKDYFLNKNVSTYDKFTTTDLLSMGNAVQNYLQNPILKFMNKPSGNISLYK